MSCDESLNYYVTRMAELKSNYDAEIAACESKLSVAESTLINIRENIRHVAMELSVIFEVEARMAKDKERISFFQRKP